MLISVINQTRGYVSDEEMQAVLRAINRQIREDFQPYWGMGATLRLEGVSASTPSTERPADMRGEAVIYVWDHVDPDADGKHNANYRGVPYGFVFLDIAQQLDEPWSITLSHEALELIADPEVNLLVSGPHPRDHRRRVFHWYEMCDAVQDEHYSIDGIQVSNFVLPLYFTSTDELGGRNDFLGRPHGGKTLRSFGVNPGGYVGFYDPRTHRSVTFDADERAAARHRIKLRAGRVRRAVRYARDPESVTGPRRQGKRRR
jgi:hypothetical protein